MYTIEMDNFNVAFPQKHLAALVEDKHQTKREVFDNEWLWQFMKIT